MRPQSQGHPDGPARLIQDLGWGVGGVGGMERDFERGPKARSKTQLNGSADNNNYDVSTDGLFDAQRRAERF